MFKKQVNISKSNKRLRVCGYFRLEVFHWNENHLISRVSNEENELSQR